MPGRQRVSIDGACRRAAVRGPVNVLGLAGVPSDSQLADVRVVRILDRRGVRVRRAGAVLAGRRARAARRRDLRLSGRVRGPDRLPRWGSTRADTHSAGVGDEPRALVLGTGSGRPGRGSVVCRALDSCAAKVRVGEVCGFQPCVGELGTVELDPAQHSTTKIGLRERGALEIDVLSWASRRTAAKSTTSRRSTLLTTALRGSACARSVRGPGSPCSHGGPGQRSSLSRRSSDLCPSSWYRSSCCSRSRSASRPRSWSSW